MATPLAEDFRVLPNPDYRPARLALARRYRDSTAAIQDMGEGVVIGVSTDGTERLVAFHERHLPLIERRTQTRGA